MRLRIPTGLLLALAGLGISCHAPSGRSGSPSTASPPGRDTLVVRPVVRSRTSSARRPATARVGARPRPARGRTARRRARPGGWVARLEGRVQAASRALKGTGHVAALAAAGQVLVTVDQGFHNTWSRLQGWDVRSRKVLWSMSAPARQVSLSLSADGRSMLLTTGAGTNYVYRLQGGKPRIYRRWRRKRGPRRGRTQGLSALGAMLIRGDVRGQVRGYSLARYKMKWLVRGRRVILSRDGRVAAVVRGRQVRMLDSVTGRRLSKPWRYTGDLVAMAPHSRGRWAAILRRGRSCWLHLVGGKPLPLACVKHAHLAWSSGGKLLGVAGDGAAWVIRVSDGRVLSKHRSRFWAPLKVAFPSDRSFVLANEVGGQLSFYRLVRR